VAVKRNFLQQQKELKQLKEDNQNLGLDLINLTKDNERTKNNGYQLEDKSSISSKKAEQDQLDQMMRLNKKSEETIGFLRNELERYKK
jgi:hypothetical protein